MKDTSKITKWKEKDTQGPNSIRCTKIVNVVARVNRIGHTKYCRHYNKIISRCNTHADKYRHGQMDMKKKRGRQYMYEC